MADQQIQSQIRTPAGGMNQDDSIITPSKDSAGRNAFEVMDYRYALNARIGSSREDNFGDLEDIRDTVQVTSYFRRVQLYGSSSFFDNIDAFNTWSGNASSWFYFGGAARMTTPGGPFDSGVLYQPVWINVVPNQKSLIACNLNASLISSGTLYVTFMDSDGNVTSEEELYSGVLSGNMNIKKYVTPPPDITGIGFRLTGTTSSPVAFDISYFTANAYKLTSNPSGSEKVIGKYEDREFLRLYYFVWREDGQHTIRYYDKTTNYIVELLKWSGLNFKSNYFVKAAKLDNWMAFTDRNNSPRLIDTDTISDLYFTLGDSDFREFHISFHKWAPTRPITPRIYYDNVTNNYEKLKGKIYQFSYRYIYKGYLKSRWSPASVAVNTESFGSGTYSSGPSDMITAIELYMPGMLLDQPGADVSYNYFDHSDVKFKEAVISIEIAYRENQFDLWRKYKTIDIDNYSDIQRFEGKSNSTPVSTDDFSQLFDTVPFLAGTVEAIDNRFMFADCIDEYEPASTPALTNVGTVQWPTSRPIGTWWNATFGSTFTSLSSPDAVELAKRNSLTDFTWKSRGLYKVGIIYHDHRGWTSGVYTYDAWGYEIPASTKVTEGQYALTFKFSDSWKPPEWAVAYQIVRTQCLNIDAFIFGLVNGFTPLVDDVSTILDKTTLPENIKDRIRQHFENTRLINGDEIIAEAERVTLDEVNRDAKKKRFGNTVLKVNRLIGDFSSSASIRHSNRNIEKLLRRNPIAVKLIPEIRKTKEINVVENSSRLYIDINNWYQSSKKTAGTDVDNPMNNLYYNYREGDRVRFVGSDVANPTPEQKKIYDVKILEFTAKGIIIEKPSEVKWRPKADVVGTVPDDMIIEVYTPLIPEDEDFIYYETGEWYPVLFPGTIKRDWSKKDWTYTNNAAVTATTNGDFIVYSKHPFTHGDSHFLTKNQYRDYDSSGLILHAVVASSMVPLKDETYSYWDRANGRPNAAYENLPVARFKPTQVRFGGKIVEESFVNNLNRFQDDDQFIYPSEYGRIRDLVNTANAQVESVGSIMLAIGERETWSIYINRQTLEDLSGRSQVAEADQVLGSFNTLLGGYGTLNPESVCREKGRVYFWCELEGAWIRYGRDGLTEISTYKMRNWFREIGLLITDAYQSSDIPKAICEFDTYNEELVTFIDHSSLPEEFRGYSKYKGCVFSEDDVRWKQVHSYEPEMFGKVGALLISFKNGGLYLHEKGTGYNTFYGVKQDVQWEPVFNDNPQYKKSWQAIANLSTHKWSVERILSEFRGDKQKQQSRININQFSEKEDMYFAAIPNNLNTPNVSNPIIEGDKMRSKAIQVLMQLDQTVVTKSLLHYVYAETIDSPKNP